MPTFNAIGQNGIAAIIDYLRKIPDDGKCRQISIILHRAKRSVSQNRLYRLWLSLIAHETGNSADDLHDVFRTMFLGTNSVIIGNFNANTPISTTTLDSAQFSSFLEQLEAWVTSEIGVILPHPEDQYWNDFEQKYGYDSR